MATIEDLYKYFEILAEAKEDAGKHVDTYLKIIECTKRGPKEKQLASQFITRFFKYFSKDTGNLAVDALFDLCEDEDVNIRKQAIKDLSTICKDNPEHINRVADILTQLLQTDDQHESMQVQNSLLCVLKQNPKATFTEMFNQINTAEIEEIRKRAIRFLVTKIPQLEGTVLTKEVEEFLIKQIKTVLVDVDAEEFTLLIRLLTLLPTMNTLVGRQDVLNIIVAQCELDKPIEENDIERLMILLSCTQQALPLFSKNVHSAKFLVYYLDNVFTLLHKLNEDETSKLELLKCFAEMAYFLPANSIPEHETRLLKLFNLLLDYLPLPSETAETSDETKFNFSVVECLLFSFHELAKLYPSFLADDSNKDRLKEFKLRLQYFAKGTQNYIKELKNTITGEDTQENKVRKVALRITTNIDTLIKDFFHVPPSYKSTVMLSFKTPQPAAATANATADSARKRSLSSDKNGDHGFKKKPERDVYHPPSGKYSSSTSNGNSNANGNGTNGNNGAANGFKRNFNRKNRF